MRFTESTKKIKNIDKVLCHYPQKNIREILFGNAESNIISLKGRLKRTNRKGAVVEDETVKGCFHVSLELDHDPLVSIIIPTAGKTVAYRKRQVDLIQNVVKQIIKRSNYKNIELIIVHNGNLLSAQVRNLSKLGCKLILYSDPIFNISKKLNLGFKHISGKYLIIMNDDIEIINPFWIEKMLEHFSKSHVGVVGAKLLYPDKKIQHVGVIHNLGNPDHVRRLYPRDDEGYFFSTCGVRNFMGVTGAVMMTRSDLYKSLGGFSEELAVSYNDVDFCLKAYEKGFYTLYSPKAELTHMESQSRVAFADKAEVEYYKNRWASLTTFDCFYNEQVLDIQPSSFTPVLNVKQL